LKSWKQRASLPSQHPIQNISLRVNNPLPRYNHQIMNSRAVWMIIEEIRLVIAETPEEKNASILYRKLSYAWV